MKKQNDTSENLSLFLKENESDFLVVEYQDEEDDEGIITIDRPNLEKTLQVYYNNVR